MTDKPIRVTTESVMASIELFVKDRGENRFTTADIARAMGAEEYPVRAAVSWLARYKLIEIIPGVRSRRNLPPQDDRRWHCDNYSVSMYRLREQSGTANFAALMGAFCRG